MEKIIISILSTALVVYVFVGAFLFMAQDVFIYYPTQKTDNAHNQKIFLNDGESIFATTLNLGKKKAIIYFGGNAEDVDDNVLKFRETFKDHTLYLVKYRGYANSTGRPTQANLFSDALFVYDSVKAEHSNVSIIGRSLGTGVATFLTARRDVHRLVLVTPFDSLQSVVQKRMPFYPISLLLRDKYDSLSEVSHVKVQTLILAAQNDKIIEKKSTMNLANAFAPSRLTMKILENENHNSISNHEKYHSLIKTFLND